jgi:hypothetical protein
MNTGFRKKCLNPRLGYKKRRLSSANCAASGKLSGAALAAEPGRGRVFGPSGAAVKLRTSPSTLERRMKARDIRKSHSNSAEALYRITGLRQIQQIRHASATAPTSFFFFSRLRMAGSLLSESGMAMARWLRRQEGRKMLALPIGSGARLHM